MRPFFVEKTVASVLGLGVTTTIGYGTLLYAFTLLSLELEWHFLWSKSFVFGVFSLGLLVGGLIAPWAGRSLDRYGARIIMSAGSLLAALGLGLLALVETKLGYVLAMLFTQMSATLVLYEAAFVAFSQIAKDKARLPMTQITLIAGFASTIFWPLVGWLLGFLSWREVYGILALLHLLLCAPLHWWVLGRGVGGFVPVKTEKSPVLEGDKRTAFVLLGASFALIAIPTAAVQTHFVGLLNALGVETSLAISLGLLLGPLQVGARVLEMLGARKISPFHSALLSYGLLTLGVWLMLLSGVNVLFATLFITFFGAGQGINYVARGALPLAIFGTQGYGHLTGKLNRYKIIAAALAPFSFAYIFEHVGIFPALVLLGVLTTCATVLLVVLGKIMKRF
ncbi:MAG: MFS transporter [Campylobacterales bacterium]|nr:MFS transporter [Campylobacterales bacterium]